MLVSATTAYSQPPDEENVVRPTVAGLISPVSPTLVKLPGRAAAHVEPVLLDRRRIAVARPADHGEHLARRGCPAPRSRR